MKVRPGASLLLINHEAPLRDALSRSLQQRGHVVYPAANLSEALEVLAHLVVDIILLDISRPEIDGSSHCHALHQRSQSPIIMMSAADRPEDIARGFGVGADDYICKPFQLRELEQHIQQALHRSLQTGQRPCRV